MTLYNNNNVSNSVLVRRQAVCATLDRDSLHFSLSRLLKVSLSSSALPTKNLRLRFIRLPKAGQWGADQCCEFEMSYNQALSWVQARSAEPCCGWGALCEVRDVEVPRKGGYLRLELTLKGMSRDEPWAVARRPRFRSEKGEYGFPIEDVKMNAGRPLCRLQPSLTTGKLSVRPLGSEGIPLPKPRPHSLFKLNVLHANSWPDKRMPSDTFDYF